MQNCHSQSCKPKMKPNRSTFRNKAVSKTRTIPVTNNTRTSSQSQFAASQSTPSSLASSWLTSSSTIPSATCYSEFSDTEGMTRLDYDLLGLGIDDVATTYPVEISVESSTIHLDQIDESTGDVHLLQESRWNECKHMLHAKQTCVI
jgi:hypothetical protein